ncbi:hypothetical protein BGX20_003893 [Mortierella sp. AD010]|nr:hypothetical protein BGX20_003893 [Mortierella sp. AD010]
MSNTPHYGSLSQLLATKGSYCGTFGQERDYDAEEEDGVDSESGVEVGQSKIRAARINLISDFTLDHLDRLTDSDSWETDQSGNSDDEDYDSASSGNHGIRFGYQDDPLTGSANTSSDEDDYGDEYDDDGHSETERTNNTGQSRPGMESKITRTRIEAMLDSYVEVYNLDLSKCVQTIELDLRIIAMAPATDIHTIKRILKRLSPFTHLRLIWADGESSESQANGFEAVMGHMHSQIRHIHFSPGFVISKSWVREMEKMVKLETVTLESMGSLDVIEFDWTKIKCLRMNAVIPRNIFGMPIIPLSTMATAPNIAGDIHDGALIVATTSIQAVLASATTTATGYGSAAPNAAITTTSVTHSYSNIVTSQELGLAAISTTDDTNVLDTRVPGWCQWMSLRKIEIRIRNTILPREWLREFVATITQNSVILEQQQKRLKTSVPRHRTDSATVSFGLPLEILDIDCAISHPHKDIFTQLVHAWGCRFEEFHVHQSAELTDDFFWLCLQKMTRVKKLSLRESRGITGEGVAYCSDGAMKTDHCTFASTLHAPNFGAGVNCNSSTTTSKAAKTPIMWRREFSELNLDQSRIRREFLETLKQRCPGVR